MDRYAPEVDENRGPRRLFADTVPGQKSAELLGARHYPDCSGNQFIEGAEAFLRFLRHFGDAQRIRCAELDLARCAAATACIPCVHRFACTASRSNRCSPRSEPLGNAPAPDVSCCDAQSGRAKMRASAISKEFFVNLQTQGLAGAELARALDRYRSPNPARSVSELAVTVVPLALLWTLAWLVFWLGFTWATPLFAIAAAGFLVRLFMIQHDCGHGAFFPRRSANDWVGRVIGVLTLTPYDYWRRTHAVHHATSGNLDRRGIGDIDTLTVAEYLARSRLGRLRYRIYRHPLMMFGVGPAYLFFVQHRLPVGLMRAGWAPWISAMATNAGIAALLLVAAWLIGLEALVFIVVPTMLLAAAAGVWLFYVQHQFEHTSWEHDADWSLQATALHGSSHYDLPIVLRWLTANIGIHHVHHLCSRIPYYRLPAVLQGHPALRNVGRLGLLDSFRCVRLVLWSESEKRLVSFAEISGKAAS
jgi:omega-6 fatty acid desaturase (delta-12 desaturase)